MISSPMSSAISPRLEQDAGFPSNLSLTTGKGEQLSKSHFGDLFRDSIGEVDKLEQQAHRAIQGLMTGNGVDVHQALIAAEKANAAFDLTLAVRNKAIQSYQSVMSMQF
jgi:flagellar hook-basal body complex protein FliE